ncbi:MAG: bifunctional pyr operon transcriptional regulator/uracil phosphoribosyltransferase PyrR [Phycisphaerales bacterium]|nr:bifunctional pyr operon transcriptional regulator/uracil phosphoribosyltransferase PyrR [Phycisphaerales bacterium]
MPASTIQNKAELHQTLVNMAADIAAARPAGVKFALVGIRRRGETLAQRLAPLLQQLGAGPHMQGAVDITLYRDDLTTIGPDAVVHGTEIDFDITDTWLVLVDDVLYTGRSVRAALDALIDLGRPKAIRLAVLVDRGWRELPIRPDFVGTTVETTEQQIIKVKLEEVDGSDGIDLV